jgi:hypothetical protein
MTYATTMEAQDFLSKAKDLGIIDEINQRLEERNHDHRKDLIAQLNALPKEDPRALNLSKEAAEAHKEWQKAEEALTAARNKCHSLSVQSYGAGIQFEGRRSALEREIKALTPEFMRNAYIDLDYFHNQSRHVVRLSIETRWGFLGAYKEETSNVGDVDKFRQEIAQARQRVLDMMLEPTDLPKAEAEIDLMCESIKKRAFELGVNEREFNDWRKPRAAADKEEDRRHKASAARRNAITALSI